MARPGVEVGERALGKTLNGWANGATVVGLAVWTLAVGLAYWAQQRILQADGVNPGTAGFLLAGILAVAASYPLYGRSPLGDDRLGAGADLKTPASAPVRNVRLAALFAVAGLIALALSLYYLIWPKLGWHGFSAWCAALALLTAAATLAWERPRRPGQWRERMPEIAIVLGLTLAAAALRLGALTQIPPDVHGDEAEIALWSRRILSGGVQDPFAAGWSGLPGLSFLPTAASIVAFGDNLYGVRMASAVQGILTVPLLYLVVKKLFDTRVALVAAGLLVFSQWHIHYSRSGLSNIGALVASLLLFYFFLRGLERRRPTDFVLAGFLAGVCLNTYYAARIAPVFLALYATHRALHEKHFLHVYWRGFALAGAGFVAFMSPLIVYYWQEPQAFMLRAQGAFLLSPNSLSHAMAAYGVNSLAQVLAEQARRSLLAFNLLGETSQQFGYRAPLLDQWTGPLFVLGAAVATFRPARASMFFVASWFWLSLVIGSVLTVDAMFSPRMIALVPVPFVFAALAVDLGWRGLAAIGGRNGRALALALLVPLIWLAASANYHNYFAVFPVKMPAGFFTAAGRYLAETNDRYQGYLIGRPSTRVTHETLRFLVPDLDAVQMKDESLPLPPNAVPRDKGIVFIIEPGAPDAEERLRELRAVYPAGHEEEHRRSNGAPGFIAYRVERADLLAALR